MAKFYGEIGYAETKEISPGVWEEVITERVYSGELIRSSRRLQGSEYLNETLISIMKSALYLTLTHIRIFIS